MGLGTVSSLWSACDFFTDFNLLLLVVGWMCEGTTAAGGDEMHLRVPRLGLVPAIVVQITSQKGANLAILPSQLANHGQRFVFRLKPVGSMQNDDDFVSFFDLLGNPFKIMPLRDVEAVAQRNVHAPYPPSVGQFECEIATLLPTPPAADDRGLVAELI